MPRSVAALVVCGVLAVPASAQDPSSGKEPWPPDPATLEAQRVAAEGRPLFQSQEPLAFTLTADFKHLNRDRKEERAKKQHFSGVLTVAGADGRPRAIKVTMRTRGKFRLRTCSFVPLRVEFPKEGLEGTPFEGQSALKLVTHCEDGEQYEQYMYREYLAYRLLNALTHRSFRARLARATYVDSVKGREVGPRPALWLEAEKDVARRLSGRILDMKGRRPAQMDGETLTTMMLFEFMIGNTDFSIPALHNVVLVQDAATRRLFPVPYDFNHSGLVNAVYAAPSPKLPIKSVVQRLYRGPCRSAEELGPVLLRFQERKREIMALPEAVPGMKKAAQRDAADYLDAFYDTLSRPRSVKSHFVEGCPD